MKGLKGALFITLIGQLLCVGCKENALTPMSYGHAYEAIVVGDKDSMIYQLLSEPMVGLPQSEPTFDVTMVSKANFKADSRLVRNVVIVEIDKQKHKAVNVSSRRNVYAAPQLILTIDAPSKEALHNFLISNGKKLRNYLVKEELHRTQVHLAKHRNVEAEAKIRKLFGIDIQVPVELQASKEGKNFLWLSNNATSGVSNLCLYTINEGDFRQQRDSVMQRNILGERNNMYVQTSAIVLTSINKEVSTTIRGLWEMKNDAMGGPFVAYMRKHKPLLQRHILVAEAFVYAPESKKRNKLRALEAALYTWKE